MEKQWDLLCTVIQTDSKSFLYLILLMFRKTSCQLGKPAHITPFSRNYTLDVEECFFFSFCRLHISKPASLAPEVQMTNMPQKGFRPQFSLWNVTNVFCSLSLISLRSRNKNILMFLWIKYAPFNATSGHFWYCNKTKRCCSRSVCMERLQQWFRLPAYVRFLGVQRTESLDFL